MTTSATPIRTEIRTLWRLSWPMLVGQLATVGMGVADVAMTGPRQRRRAGGGVAGRLGVVDRAGDRDGHDDGDQHRRRARNRAPAQLRPDPALGAPGAVERRWASAWSRLPARQPVHAAVRPYRAGRRRGGASASLFVHVISVGMPAFACYRALYGYTTSINQTKPIMVIAILGLLFNIARQLAAGVRQLGLAAPGRGRLRGGHRHRHVADAGRHAVRGSARSPAYRLTYPFTALGRPGLAAKSAACCAWACRSA